MSPRIIQLLVRPKSSAIGIVSRFMLLSKDIVVQHNIPYAKRYTCELDVYSDSSIYSAVSKPALIVIHGGGWITGDKRERTLFCANLAKEGYIVFSINYRLAPQFPFPTAINDAVQAIQWVSAHASEYGANPQHISVIGDSAGAHIASLATISPTIRKYVKKLILYYGIYNLETVQHINRPFMHIYLRALAGKSSAPLPPSASPISHVRDFPSTLLIASEKDPLHMQTIELAKAMKNAGVEHEVTLLTTQNYPHANHGFQNLPRSKAAKAAFTAMSSFLRT